MMDGSSQLALSVGNQIKSVAKAEQDRQLAPPVPSSSAAG
jgi:hypothetical protein